MDFISQPDDFYRLVLNHRNLHYHDLLALNVSCKKISQILHQKYIVHHLEIDFDTHVIIPHHDSTSDEQSVIKRPYRHDKHYVSSTSHAIDPIHTIDILSDDRDAVFESCSSMNHINTPSSHHQKTFNLKKRKYQPSASNHLCMTDHKDNQLEAFVHLRLLRHIGLYLQSLVINVASTAHMKMNMLKFAQWTSQTPQLKELHIRVVSSHIDESPFDLPDSSSSLPLKSKLTPLLSIWRPAQLRAIHLHDCNPIIVDSFIELNATHQLHTIRYTHSNYTSYQPSSLILMDKWTTSLIPWIPRLVHLNIDTVLQSTISAPYYSPASSLINKIFELKGLRSLSLTWIINSDTAHDESIIQFPPLLEKLTLGFLCSAHTQELLHADLFADSIKRFEFPISLKQLHLRHCLSWSQDAAAATPHNVFTLNESFIQNKILSQHIQLEQLYIHNLPIMATSCTQNTIDRHQGDHEHHQHHHHIDQAKVSCLSQLFAHLTHLGITFDNFAWIRPRNSLISWHQLHYYLQLNQQRLTCLEFTLFSNDIHSHITHHDIPCIKNHYETDGYDYNALLTSHLSTSSTALTSSKSHLIQPVSTFIKSKSSIASSFSSIASPFRNLSSLRLTHYKTASQLYTHLASMLIPMNIPDSLFHHVEWQHIQCLELPEMKHFNNLHTGAARWISKIPHLRQLTYLHNIAERVIWHCFGSRNVNTSGLLTLRCASISLNGLSAQSLNITTFDMDTLIHNFYSTCKFKNMDVITKDVVVRDVSHLLVPLHLKTLSFKISPPSLSSFSSSSSSSCSTSSLHLSFFLSFNHHHHLQYMTLFCAYELLDAHVSMLPPQLLMLRTRSNFSDSMSFHLPRTLQTLQLYSQQWSTSALIGLPPTLKTLSLPDTTHLYFSMTSNHIRLYQHLTCLTLEKNNCSPSYRKTLVLALRDMTELKHLVLDDWVWGHHDPLPIRLQSLHLTSYQAYFDANRIHQLPCSLRILQHDGRWNVDMSMITRLFDALHQHDNVQQDGVHINNDNIYNDIVDGGGDDDDDDAMHDQMNHNNTRMANATLHPLHASASASSSSSNLSNLQPFSVKQIHMDEVIMALLFVLSSKRIKFLLNRVVEDEKILPCLIKDKAEPVTVLFDTQGSIIDDSSPYTHHWSAIDTHEQKYRLLEPLYKYNLIMDYNDPLVRHNFTQLQQSIRLDIVFNPSTMNNFNRYPYRYHVNLTPSKLYDFIGNIHLDLQLNPQSNILLTLPKSTIQCTIPSNLLIRDHLHFYPSNSLSLNHTWTIPSQLKSLHVTRCSPIQLEYLACDIDELTISCNRNNNQLSDYLIELNHHKVKHLRVYASTLHLSPSKSHLSPSLSSSTVSSLSSSSSSLTSSLLLPIPYSLKKISLMNCRLNDDELMLFHDLEHLHVDQLRLTDWFGKKLLTHVNTNDTDHHESRQRYLKIATSTCYDYSLGLHRELDQLVCSWCTSPNVQSLSINKYIRSKLFREVMK